MSEQPKNKLQSLLAFLGLGAVGENIGLTSTAPVLGYRSTQANTRLSEIRRQQEELLRRARETTNQAEKARLLGQSRQLSSQTETLGSDIRRLTETTRRAGQVSDKDLTKSNLQFALGQGGRQTAGLASYAIPFGRTVPSGGRVINALTKFLLPGAGVGTLQAASEEGATVKDLLSGAAGGAAGAGLLGAGGAILSKTKGGLLRTGQKLLDKSVANFMKTSPAVFQKAAEAGININKVFQKYFKPNDKIDDLIGIIGKKNTGKLQGVLGEAEKVINKTISNSGDDVIANSQDLTKPLMEVLAKLKKTPGNAAKATQLETFIREVQTLYQGGLNGKQLLDVKRIFDHQFGASVVDDATGAVIRDAQKSIANTARDILKNTFTTIKNALDNESDLLTLRPILERARATAETSALRQPGGMGLVDVLLGLGGVVGGNPLLGAGLIAGKQALQSPTALNLAGKAVSTVGSIPGVTNPLVNAILAQASSRAGGKAAQSLVSPAEPEQVPENQQQNEPTKQIDLSTIDRSTLSQQQQKGLDVIDQAEAQAKGDGTMGGIGNITPEMAMLAQLTLSPKDLAKFNNIYDLQQEQSKSQEGKALPAGELAKLAEQQSAIELVPELQTVFDESKEAFGPITGSLRQLNPYDDKSQKAQSTIFLVKQIIGKGLEGGVLRKEDEYKYEKILPKLSDTPKQVQNKIDLLENVLQQKYDTTISTFKKGGYNPSSGQPVSEQDQLLDLLSKQGLSL